MKLKIFTLRLDPATGKFDDKDLAEFQLDKDIIEVSEHFLVHEKTPTLALVLRYRELPCLEKLRVLLRISHDERYLDHKGFEFAARNIDEAGRMIGGWLRSRSAP